MHVATLLLFSPLWQVVVCNSTTSYPSSNYQNLLPCKVEVGSSRCSLSNSPPLAMNDERSIFEAYLVEFTNAVVEKYHLRQVLVVGGSPDDVPLAQPQLFNSYPYVVCTDPEKCVYPEFFTRGSLAIFFLDDLNGKTLKKNAGILAGIGSSSKCLIVYKGPLQDDDIPQFFKRLTKEVSVLCELVHIDENIVRHRRSFLTHDCSLGIESRAVWKPASDIDIGSWAYETRDFNGCPVKVSTARSDPKMVITVNPDGSLSIVGGQEGHLLLTMAELLNFTISPDSPIVIDQLNYTSNSGVLHDIASQTADFGISRFRPTTESIKVLDHSDSYHQTCYGWAVSHKMSDSTAVMWAEFAWVVWASVALMFIISCVVNYAHDNFCSLSRNGNQRSVGLVAVILDVISLNLGNPVIHVSVCVGGRLLLMFSLLYSLVIKTAYTTALASILMTGRVLPVAEDLAGIISAGLPVGSSRYNMEVMKELYFDDGHQEELRRRFVVLDDASEAINGLQSAKGFAVFTLRSTLKYWQQLVARDRKLITFNILDPCALTFHAVIAVQKGSFLLQPMNEILGGLHEAGFLGHWDKIVSSWVHKALLHDNANMLSAVQMQQKLKQFFFLYCLFFIHCFLVFFVELLFGIFYSKKRHRVVRLKSQLVQTWRSLARKD